MTVATIRRDGIPASKIYTVLIIFPLVEHFWHIDRLRLGLSQGNKKGFNFWRVHCNSYRCEADK